MKILSISNMDIWPAGENKGIPSIFFSQTGFAQRGNSVYFLCPARGKQVGFAPYQGIKIFRFKLPLAKVFARINRLPLDNIFSHLFSALLSNLEWLLFQLFCFFQAMRLARKIQPQLVYAHSLASAFVGWLISRMFKSKLVVRIYGSHDLYWRFQNPLLRLKEFRDFLSLRLPADLLVVTQDGTRAKDLALKLGVKEGKILCLRNGVDFNIFNPGPDIKQALCKELGIHTNSKIILSLAKLSTFYRVEQLVYSLPQVLRTDPSALCIIARDGPLEGLLKNFVREHHIQDRVLFVGYVEHNFVNRLLNSCDIYVSLSRFSNTNNSLHEAMVCGKCILSAKDETIEETLTHKKNAFLIPEDELGNLASVLRGLLVDDDLRRFLGEQARIRAREILEPWPERINREAEILEDLVRGR